MGLFSRADKVLSVVPNLPAGTLSPTIPLAQVLFPDVDTAEFPVTVDEAMRVPAVKRAVSIYASIGARFKLTASDGGSSWMEKTTGPITPELRKAWTIQDLIFHNESMWRVTERDQAGAILDAEYLEHGRWRADEDGDIEVDSEPQDQGDLIWIGGLSFGGGFLEDARDSVRQYTSMARTINNRAALPQPVTLVKETQEGGATPEEVEAALDSLEEGLKSKRGGITYVPFGIEVAPYGGADGDSRTMLIDARNAIRLDLANHLNINASILEAVAAGSSDSYTNTLMVQNELLELSIKAFTEPIAQRLSQDDVTPEGVTVTLDYSTFDTAPATKGSLGTVPSSDQEVTND